MPGLTRTLLFDWLSFGTLTFWISVVFVILVGFLQSLQFLFESCKFKPARWPSMLMKAVGKNSRVAPLIRISHNLWMTPEKGDLSAARAAGPRRRDLRHTLAHPEQLIGQRSAMAKDYAFSIPITIGGLLQLNGQRMGYGAIQKYKDRLRNVGFAEYKSFGKRLGSLLSLLQSQ